LLMLLKRKRRKPMKMVRNNEGLFDFSIEEFEASWD